MASEQTEFAEHQTLSVKERVVAWTWSQKSSFRDGQKQKENMNKLQVAILAAALVGAGSASASVTMTFNNVSPNEIVSLNGESVYAGIYNLSVNGVATPSFCIDVAHNISGGATYNDFNLISLDSAPNSPAGPMGASAATLIEGLWGTYYSAATTSASEAAALQVAIWMAVNKGAHPVTLIFGSDATTAAAVSEADTMLANITAYASLEGLVGSPADNTQGFVVAVPEATTVIAGALLLLPLGASMLRILRKTRQP